MAFLYLDCEHCNGYGYFMCTSCEECTSCNGRGYHICTQCTAGRVDCPECGASGSIVVQRPFLRLFMRPVRESCRRCSVGKVPCTVCQNPLQQIRCERCKGERYEATCERCSGSRKISCPSCQGRGKFKSDWLKSLPSLSRDRLVFEHEKFRSQRTNLELKLLRLHHGYDRDETAISGCQTEIKEVDKILRLIESRLSRLS